MSQTDDLFLVSRVILFDDRKAFDSLVRKYQGGIRRFFLHLTFGNTETSNDLSQETFIKAYLYLRSFKGSARFSTWLYRIAYNVFYDHKRSMHKELPLEMDGGKELGTHNYGISDQIHMNIDVMESLKVLKEEERIAIILFYLEDFHYDKISDIMKCPVGTIKTHLHRGKEKLATYFKKSGYERTSIG